MYIHDENRVKQMIELFRDFVAKQQDGRKAEFKSGYLLKHEGYKAGVYIRANDILLSEKWKPRMIKSGEIAARMAEAIYVKDNNFVSWRNKDDFKKALLERPVEGGQALYDLFMEDDDQTALEELVKFIGARHYDLISTLFYMKNPDVYFPCKPRFFRKAFTALEMDTSCVKSCTYENYVQFNEEIRELTEFYSQYVEHIDYLDGHSFAWIIGAYNEVQDYIFEKQSDDSDSDDTPRREGRGTVTTRLAQSEYRKNLLEYWDGRCAVTGCELTDVLIASHAKPWSECDTHQESISKYNGLLLTPNLDRLFDLKHITFDENGGIVISSRIPSSDYKSLGISKEMRLRKIEEGHQEYLAYHREIFFKG